MGRNSPKVNSTATHGRKRRVALDQVARGLRESASRSKGPELIESREAVSATYGVDHESYQEAEKLKQRLLKKYRGKTLDDITGGNELETESGVCYRMEGQQKITLELVNPEYTRACILSELRLIRGVGEVTEGILREEGYGTIEDLAGHPRFGPEARKLMRVLDRSDAARILNWLVHWLPKSHPLVLYTSGYCRREDFVVFDIETMGLSARPIILLGVGEISGSHIRISQYLLRDLDEEPAALTGFLSHIVEGSVFLTFNGRSFDVPYVRDRLAYYRMSADLENTHFDILHFSRRAWRERVPDCRLGTLEKCLLGSERGDDVPSALVPEFYETYMATDNIGPLIPIIEHNRQDLVVLARIFSRLHEEWG